MTVGHLFPRLILYRIMELQYPKKKENLFLLLKNKELLVS